MIAYSGSRVPVGVSSRLNGYGARSEAQNAGVHSNGNGVAARAASLEARSADDLGRRNRALREVSTRDWTRFSARLERAVLVPGQTLHDSGGTVERVYFPNSGLVSMVVDGADDEVVEAALCGREGIVGALEAINGEPSHLRAMVQAPGTAMWMTAADFREEWSRGGALQAWVLRYMAFFNSQSSQSALCNRMHTVEERLARWLLQVSQRLESDDVSITHEFVSHMLGTRRSGVTIGLGVLQKAGLLDLTRGRIAITDRQGLEGSACVCHGTLKRGFDSLWASKNA